MVMPADKRPDIVFADGIGHRVPIIDVALHHRVMRNQKNRPFGSVVRELLFEPANVLRRDVPFGHPDHRPRIESKKQVIPVLEPETVGTENAPESGRSGLAPLGFVIPGSNVIFQFQPVEDRFGFPQRGIVSVIGEIARNDYEAQSRRRIDLIDGMSQVVGGQRIGRDVQIAHQRKTESFRTGRHNGQQQNGKQHSFHNPQYFKPSTKVTDSGHFRRRNERKNTGFAELGSFRRKNTGIRFLASALYLSVNKYNRTKLNLFL